MKRIFLSTLLLIAYWILLIKIMVFKDIPVVRLGSLIFKFRGTHEGPGNFIPFKTILSYFLGHHGFFIGGINLVGNIALLVPVGFLAPFAYRKMTWKKSLALAFASGLAIEGMQVIFHVGIFDIDDILLNGLGVMVGYWAFLFFRNKTRSMKSRHVIIAAALVITFLLAILGFILYQKKLLPVRFESGREKSLSDRLDRKTHQPFLPHFGIL